MGIPTIDLVVGVGLMTGLWLWVRYGAWHGIRGQGRAAWLRPATLRRTLRAARRRSRALDREIHSFLRRAAGQRRPVPRPGAQGGERQQADREAPGNAPRGRRGGGRPE